MCVFACECMSSLPATFDKTGIGFNVCVYCNMFLCYHSLHLTQIGSSVREFVCVCEHLSVCQAEKLQFYQWIQMQRIAEVACVYVLISMYVSVQSRQDVETAHLKLLMHMTRQHEYHHMKSQHLKELISPKEI